MSFKKFSILAVGSMLSASLFAAVNITAPEEIVLLAVNDQEVNAGLLRTAKNNYKVDAGQVSLSVRYQQFFKHLDGEHDIAKSGVVTITAPNLIDGQTYQLKPINVPNNYDDAKKYAEQPTIALYDHNNQLVVQQTGANRQAKSWLGGGVLGRVFDYTKPSSANQPAPVYTSATTTTKSSAVTTAAPVTGTTTVTTTSASAAATAQHPTADQQLIRIWQGASKAERQRFMSWLAEQ